MPFDVSRRVRGGLLLAALAAPWPSAAQSLPDDVRCLLLSTAYARAATDDVTRRSAALTGSFYLGRLSGHLADAALAAAVRAQGSGMPGKEAQPIMRACAARAAAAEQKLSAIARAAQGH